MNEIKKYVISIIGVAIISLIADFSLADGKIKNYCRFALAIILSLAFIVPIKNIIPQNDFNIELDEYRVDNSSAICSAVKSVYKNSSVTVSGEKVFIDISNEKILDRVKNELIKDNLIEVLFRLYGVEKENIIFTE